MSETSTKFALPRSTVYSFDRMNWTVGYLDAPKNVLRLGGADYDAIRRAEIASSMPSPTQLDLLVGPPPNDWLAEPEW